MRRLRVASVRGHTFCGAFLDRDSTVIDLGAHAGGFSLAVTRAFKCKVYAVEAHPELCGKIANDPLIIKSNCAVAASAGIVDFKLAQDPEAGTIKYLEPGELVGTIKVSAVTLADLMRSNGLDSIELLKVDIEGSEIELFASTSDETLRRIAQITVEFHDYIPSRVSAQEVDSVSRRLCSLGFWKMVFSRRSNMDVLFVNQARLPLSALECLMLRYVAKNALWTSRKFRGGIRRLGTAVRSRNGVARTAL